MFNGRLTQQDFQFIALFLESFFFGIYSGIFALYLQLQYCASNKETSMMRNVIFYSICTLYCLSIALFVADILGFMVANFNKPMISALHTVLFQLTSFGCCDFLAEFILIYRCWIVWGRNTRVVIIPSILALTFLATWIACNDSLGVLSGQLVGPEWTNPVLFLSLALSLTVNALVTSLIVFRIFKVFREVKATSDSQILGVAGGSKLRRVIFIIIESGMSLFSIQLVRLVVSIVWTDTAIEASPIIVSIHEMLNGITPTIILVRTSMGLSFHDEKSLEDYAIESFQLPSSHPNSLPETGSIGIVQQDRTLEESRARDRADDDDIGVRRSDGIELENIY